MNWRIVRLRVALARMLGLHRNPLRRGSDRWESVALLIAAVLALSAVPFVLRGGTAIERANLALAHEQAASTSQTTAVLVQDTPKTTGLDAGMGQVTALGRWRAPNGAELTGQVPAVPGEKTGTPVRIWIDRSGKVSSQPLSTDQAFWRSVLADVLIMFGWVCLLGCGLAVVRWRLNRRRYADWDADWRDTEPRWTQRAH